MQEQYCISYQIDFCGCDDFFYLPWFRETCSKASFTNDCFHYVRIIAIEDGMGKPANEELQIFMKN